MLISDASSVAYEYLLLNRPIIFIDVPELFERYGKEGVHFWGRECGDVVTGTAMLKCAVEAALADPDRKRVARESMLTRVLFHPGHGTETAGRAIFSLMEAVR